MKRRRTAPPLGLLCFAILASVIVFTSPVLGDTKHVILNEPAMIGGVKLEAGTYRVEWNGAGQEVQVTFKKDGDTVATAPARLVSGKNPNGRSIETLTVAGESRILKRIAFRKEALIFDVPDATGESR